MRSGLPYHRLRASGVAALIGLLCASCSPPASVEDATISRAEGSTRRFNRVVSLDFCADQYVLKLLDREQILAVSPAATKRFSYMRAEAATVPVVRPVVEDVLVLKPDLVVRSYGGGPNAQAFFEGVGLPVLNIGWASTIDGESMGTVTGIILQVAKGLGEPARGKALVEDFRARLAAIERAPPAPGATPTAAQQALYMTPAGVTTGAGSLVHDIMISAGLTNFQRRAGWNPLPLERLAYEQPDLVAAAFFESKTTHKNAWSAARHPVARQQLVDRPTVFLDGAWTACGGWFVMDAVEALAKGAAE